MAVQNVNHFTELYYKLISLNLVHMIVLLDIYNNNKSFQLDLSLNTDITILFIYLFSVSEIRIWLLGEDWADKSSVGNLLLRRNEFETEASLPLHECAKPGKVQIEDHRISVVITPNLFNRDVSADEVTQALKKCEAMSAPGPHVLLLIIQLGTSKEKIKYMSNTMNSWSEHTMDHTLLLVMEGEKKIFIAKEKTLQNVFKEKCHKISTDQHSLVTDLFEQIKNLTKENEWNYLSLEIYELPPEMPSKKILMEKFSGFCKLLK